jgi:hypothetical protein
MYGRGGRGGGGGGGRQVCHFFLEGRCKFGGMVLPVFYYVQMEDQLTPI